MNINWKLRLNATTIAGIAAAVAGLIVMLAQVMGVQLPFAESELVAFVSAVITVIAFVINAIAVVNDPTTKGLDDSAKALSYDKPHDDAGFNPNFTKADIQKFLNTTEESYKGELPKTVKYIRMKGHTIYWGTQAPNKVNKGDYYIDRLNGDLIYQFDGTQWIPSNQYAIINEGD